MGLLHRWLSSIPACDLVPVARNYAMLRKRQDLRSATARVFLRNHRFDQQAQRFPALRTHPVIALKKVECALKALARASKIRSHVFLPGGPPRAVLSKQPVR